MSPTPDEDALSDLAFQRRTRERLRFFNAQKTGKKKTAQMSCDVICAAFAEVTPIKTGRE